MVSVDTALAEINFPNDTEIQFPLAGSYYIAITNNDTTGGHMTAANHGVTFGANIQPLDIFVNSSVNSINQFDISNTTSVTAITVTAPLNPASPADNQIIWSGGSCSVGSDLIYTAINIFPIPNSLISIRDKEEKEEEKEYEAFQRFLVRLRNEQKKNRRVIIQDNDLYEISDVSIDPEELVSFPGDKFKLSQKQLISPTIVVEEKKEGVTRKSGFFTTSR